MRSSDATVCRLFFTRWWISRIVASLVMQLRSWCRTSVTSRQSTIAPVRSPRCRMRDGAQRARSTPRASMSVRHGARPVTTSGSDSSTTDLPASSSVVDLRERLTLELAREAHAVEGGQRVRARERDHAVHVEPDETVGCAGRAPARTARGPEVGEVPEAIMREQVVRALVEGELLTAGRARLAEVGVPGDDRDRLLGRRLPLGASRRSTGTARTRVGVSSYQSGAAVSTIRAVSNASVTCARHSGLISWPDEVAVEERRGAGRPSVGDRDERVVRRSAPTARCPRTPGRRAAARRRRAGAAIRRRPRSSGPARAPDR